MEKNRQQWPSEVKWWRRTDNNNHQQEEQGTRAIQRRHHGGVLDLMVWERLVVISKELFYNFVCSIEKPIRKFRVFKVVYMF